jgi:4-phytase/acid phosphatase/peptide/nickel transport system substrate-binding protein
MKIQRIMCKAPVRLKFIKWFLGCLSIFLSLTLFVTASRAQPQYGGTLKLGIEYQSYGFDPINARMYTATSVSVAHMVMERLFDRGANGKIVPLLGLSMTPSKDGKSWTVKLRQGVRFHDGTPFNAQAVVGHWRRLLNPENRFRALPALNVIRSVEALGEYIVRFHLEHPWKPFVSVMSANTTSSVIPSPKAVAEGTHNRAPVGTGPFVFKSWNDGDRIVLAKNENYWQPGKPYLDEIILLIIPDAQTRYAAFVSGQVDVMYTDRPTHVRKLQADPRFVTHAGEGTGGGTLVMNTRKPPLDDVHVRRALAHAWDQEKYIKMVFQDTVPFVTHWYGEKLDCVAEYRYHDVEKARTLIRKYDKPVEIEYIHSATQRGVESAMVVQQLFKSIGVTVRAVPLDWGALYKRVFQRNFDLASGGIPGMDDMGVVTRLLFHTKSTWNLSGYSNEDVDRLLIKQKLSVDQETRNQIWCEVARQVNKDAPILLLCGRRYYLFATREVKGLPVPRDNYIRLDPVWLISKD